MVIPYTFFIEKHKYHCPPIAPLDLPFDEAAFQCALQLLANRKCRVGIYAGMGCMDFGHDLTAVAEMLQAPPP